MMNLEERIMSHEGVKLKKYRDSLKNWTIYVGHLCKPGEVYLGTIEDAMAYLKKDIEVAKNDLATVFPNYAAFSQVRQECLIELLFNLGRPRFMGFKKMIHAININHWDDAADELQDSKWYGQVGERRGDELTEMMRQG